ncbi:hypothetical protein P171DRAFT_50680 [Karstenula rhodostoma CBS 690.94]|uniref:Zn(2)-C6 fungal-type domain-containing protein n=1 Tax=Karstenula rhodostoma CBS 690.94 TaxID=1392251 RepID=A0A9P4UB11_9PLEO|nr:hypothetical protein P171DRAFT_50680 [Karstenula rhodostoma CBS 690.94]
MVEDNARKRAKHTRSKRGCTVCRLRKVRCDETRPACTKCTSTGRKCEGFLDLALWQPHISPQIIRPRIITAENSAEERSFAYFCRNTSAQFAAPFGNDFWKCQVLQIGERERCVKQAIVALGALHESFTDQYLPPHLQSPLAPHLLHRPSWNLTNLATKSYTCALIELKKHIVPGSYDGLHVSLLGCILFTSFEWLRGSYTAAITHLKSGLFILRQWFSSTSKNTPTAHFIRKKLVPIYIRLSIQARTLSQDALPVPWLSDGLFDPPSSEDIHNEEEHLQAARNALDVLCGDVYLSPHSLKLFSSDFTISQAASYNFSSRLSKWWTEYQKHLLPPSYSPLSSPRPENVNLTLWYTVLTLLQDSFSTADPMILDKYIPQFRQIVDLSRFLMRSSTSPSPIQRGHEPNSETPNTGRFRIDIEVIPMLYHAGSKCRHPALRREAIALLRSGQNREGLWDGWAAATLAEHIMTVEEEGVEGVEMCGPESIPWMQRVMKLQDVTDLEARTTRVRYRKFGEDDFGQWKTLTW